MVFEKLNEQRQIFYSKEQKSQAEYLDFDILSDIYDLVDCLNAFEERKRSISKLYDLNNLEGYINRLKLSISAKQAFLKHQEDR